MRHLVITIGCEYGAKGNAIGRKIAEDLNIKFYNRELVDEIIEEVGIPKEIMEKVVAAWEAEGKKITSIKRAKLYVKPEEGKAYYVVNEGLKNGSTGAVDL